MLNPPNSYNKELNTPEKPNPSRAVLLAIDERNQDQRLDNFICCVCKGVPKSHVYRIIRSGEVRVNRMRAEAKTKLCIGDVVRIPPIQVVEKQEIKTSGVDGNLYCSTLLKAASSLSILYEDEHFLAVNKPSGMAVHGGSGSSFGLIECIRTIRVHTHEDLDLVHRIDRETSGILIISKKRSALRRLQEQIRARLWKKYYTTLVLGHWPRTLRQIDLPLLKTKNSEKEARVFVNEKGDYACTKFQIVEKYQSHYSNFTLLQVQILTGRTHQIRVHTSASQFPIAGDDRYGNFELNKQLVRQGLKRMFLHAACLQLVHPATNETVVIKAPLAPELEFFLNTLQVIRSK